MQLKGSGECQTPSVINRANVVKDSNDGEKFYFKESYRNYNTDFK